MGKSNFPAKEGDSGVSVYVCRLSDIALGKEAQFITSERPDEALASKATPSEFSAYRKRFSDGQRRATPSTHLMIFCGRVASFGAFARRWSVRVGEYALFRAVSIFSAFGGGVMLFDAAESALNDLQR
jgi:hypothetical protein